MKKEGCMTKARDLMISEMYFSKDDEVLYRMVYFMCSHQCQRQGLLDTTDQA